MCIGAQSFAPSSAPSHVLAMPTPMHGRLAGCSILTPSMFLWLGDVSSLAMMSFQLRPVVLLVIALDMWGTEGLGQSLQALLALLVVIGLVLHLSLSRRRCVVLVGHHVLGGVSFSLDLYVRAVLVVLLMVVALDVVGPHRDVDGEAQALALRRAGSMSNCLSCRPGRPSASSSSCSRSRGLARILPSPSGG